MIDDQHLKELIRQTLSYPDGKVRWLRPEDLLEFALKRHGWGDSDGGFGVTYPSDLDEHARVVEKHNIPEGMVEIYGFWGPPGGYEVLVQAKLYVRELITTVEKAGISRESPILEELISRMQKM